MPFTRETAHAYAVKGNLAKAAKAKALCDRIAKLTDTCDEKDDEDAYRERRLARVRLQLDLVDAGVLKESGPSGDAKRLKELVESQARLNIQERELSMRPSPGSFKPTAPPRKASRSQPADFDPLPTARSAAKPRSPVEEPGPAQVAQDEPQPPVFIPTDLHKLE